MLSLSSVSRARSTASARFSPAATSGTLAFSAAVRVGIRLYCWKMKPMFDSRNRTSAFELRSYISLPKTQTLPSVG